MPTKLLKSEEPKGVRFVLGRVDVAGGTPSVAKGSGYTVTDVAPGQVKINFSMPGRQILSAQATPIEGTDATAHMAKVDAKTEATDVTFGIYAADATDGVLVDNVAFYFMIALSDLDA